VNYSLILCALAVRNDVATITTILDIPGVNPSRPDYDGRTALHIACDEGAYEVAKLLIDRGADIHAMARRNSLIIDCMHAK